MSEAVVMNRVFRYFMKFHGYFIAFCTIFFTSVIIVTSFTGRDLHEEPFIIEEECECLECVEAGSSSDFLIDFDRSSLP